MVKTYKVILSILLVLLIATAVVLVSGVNFNKIVNDREIESSPEITATYRDMFRTVSDINVPLLATDIDGVLYGMDTSGNVTFYKVGGDSLTPVPETGSFDVNVTCSDQKLTAKIHYLEYEGKTTGYGLFTNELYEGVYIYDYAFFKLSDFFPGYSHPDGSLLLMADVDKTRFYSEDKVYSEIFVLSADRKAEYFLNEDQRTIDLNAKMRTDYKMFTDEIDAQTGGTLHFFSSRFYTAYDEYTKYDIMSTGGTGENVDNLRYVTDVASLNFWETADGVRYFRKTDAGFVLCSYDGSAETEIESFTGSLEEDYIIDGHYILNRAAGEVYNVLDGGVRYIDYSNMVKNFTPTLFEISSDGGKCVVRGANNRNNPAVIVCDFAADKQVDYTDDVFGYIVNITVCSDGTVVLSVSTDTAGSSAYQLITGAAAAETETSASAAEE